MFDSMFIGTSGMAGYSNGLKVVSNNIANLNTPGFKKSRVMFGDAFYQQFVIGSSNRGVYSNLGQGLNVLGTPISFLPGTATQTGNPLDLAVGGEGFFVLREDSTTHYSRAGRFEFDEKGFLVSKGTGMRVAGLTAANALTDISLDGLRTHLPKATTAVKFSGNLSSTSGSHALDAVKVFDVAGETHDLKLVFTQGKGLNVDSWTVTVHDGTTEVGTGVVKFINGALDASTSKLSISYTPTGGSEFSFDLDFGTDVTSFSAGSTSTLSVASQDGFGAGFLTAQTFDTDGTMSLTYSNGQTAKAPQIALARFSSPLGLVEVGNSEFTNDNPENVRIGKAEIAGAGAINANSIEGSNVEISDEFSELIIMQRGYQACSRVVSTASQMLQDLFDMKSAR